MTIIACVDKNCAIGKDGKLLFHIKEDLQRFKKLTTGHVIVFGRKTLETFPNKEALQDRVNIMLSNSSIEKDDIFVAHSIKEVLALHRDDIFIVGGQSIYTQFLPYCNHAYITQVHKEVKEADAFGPNFELDTDWECKEKEEHEGYTFYEYWRKAK